MLCKSDEKLPKKQGEKKLIVLVMLHIKFATFQLKK